MVSGSGRIRRSSCPAIVSVGTSISEVSGAYNLSTNKIVLEIESRQAEMSLSSPLTDGIPIPFTVTGVIPRNARDSSWASHASKFSKLFNNALVKEGVQTQGNLIKQGNQVQGKFTSQARWRPFGEASVTRKTTDGEVDGEFVLTLQPGITANTPVLRSYIPAQWHEVVVPGGW